MKWRHSKEAQAQKDKDKEAIEKPSGGAPAEGELEERSPSRSEGEAESESSDSESLDMAPSDTERTEGTERSLHQTTVIKASAPGALITASSSASGGAFSFGSAGSLGSSHSGAGSANSLGGGCSELLPAHQPSVTSNPQSPEPAQAPLAGL